MGNLRNLAYINSCFNLWLKMAESNKISVHIRK